MENRLRKDSWWAKVVLLSYISIASAVSAFVTPALPELATFLGRQAGGAFLRILSAITIFFYRMTLQTLISRLQLFFQTTPQAKLATFQRQEAELLVQLTTAMCEGPQRPLLAQGEYEREILHREPAFELMRIDWAPGACTPVHDHPENGCLVKVLQGELLERRYALGKEDEPLHTATLAMGQVTYLEGAAGIHEVENAMATPAASLHIYAPAGFYDEE